MNLTPVESSWELDEAGNAIITIALPTDELLAFKMCDSWYNQLRETNGKPQIAFHLQGKGDFVTNPFDNFADLPARTTKKQGFVKMRQIAAAPQAVDYCYIFVTDYSQNRYYLGNNDWDKEEFLIQLPEKAPPPTPEDRAKSLRRQADEAYHKQDLDKAEALYNKILALSPNEQTAHARERLEEIARMRSAKQEVEKVEILVEKMKAAFQEGNYQDCLLLCDEISRHPYATDTQKDLARRYRLECDGKLKEQKQEADRLAYHNLLATADRLFSEEKWQESLKFYKGALNLFSEEPYPKEQIKRIEEILRAERRKKMLVFARFGGAFLLLALLFSVGWFFMRPQPAWGDVQARKVLRVGVHNYSPIDDFAKGVAEQFLTLVPELKETTLKTTNNSDFKTLVNMLKNGELDMVFHSGTAASEADNIVWSSEPYWVFDKVVAFFPEREGNAITLDYYAGKAVEVHEKDIAASRLQTGWQMKKMQGDTSAYLAGDKNLYGLICDLPAYLQMRKEHKNLQYLRIKGCEGWYSIAFKSDKMAMRNEVGKLLTKMKQTTAYKNLVKKLEK